MNEKEEGRGRMLRVGEGGASIPLQHDFDAFPFAAGISYIGEIQVNFGNEDSDDGGVDQTSRTSISHKQRNPEVCGAFQNTSSVKKVYNSLPPKVCTIFQEQCLVEDMSFNQNYPLFSPSLTEKPRNYISLNPSRLQEVPFRKRKVGRPKKYLVGNEAFIFSTEPLHFSNCTKHKNVEDSLGYYQTLATMSENHISTDKRNVVKNKEAHQNGFEYLSHHLSLKANSYSKTINEENPQSGQSKYVQQECVGSLQSTNNTVTKRKVGRPRKSVTNTTQPIQLDNSNCHSINPETRTDPGENVNLNILNKLSSKLGSYSRNNIQAQNQLIKQESSVHSQSRVHTLIKRKVGRPRKVVRDINIPSTLTNEYCHSMVSETQSNCIAKGCSNTANHSSLKRQSSCKTRSKIQTENQHSHKENTMSSQLQVHTLIKRKVGRPKKVVTGIHSPSKLFNEYCYAMLSETQSTFVDNTCSSISNQSIPKTDSCSKTRNEIKTENHPNEKENTMSSKLKGHTLVKRKVGRPKKVVGDMSSKYSTQFNQYSHTTVSETLSSLSNIDNACGKVSYQSNCKSGSCPKTGNELQAKNQALEKGMTFIKRKVGRPPKVAQQCLGGSFDLELCSDFCNEHEEDVIGKINMGVDQLSQIDNDVLTKHKAGCSKEKFKEISLESTVAAKQKKIKRFGVSKRELNDLLAFQNTFVNGDLKSHSLRKAHSLSKNKMKSSNKIQKQNISKRTILNKSRKIVELSSVANRCTININKSSSFNYSTESILEITDNNSLNYISNKTIQSVVQDQNNTASFRTNYNNNFEQAGTSPYLSKSINQEVVIESSQLKSTLQLKLEKLSIPQREIEEKSPLELILSRKALNEEDHHHTSDDKTQDSKKYTIKVSIPKSKIGL